MFNGFIKAIWGGIAVSMGCTLYLSTDNQIAGAIFFAVGLFTIYTFGFNLYTGKVCYIPNKGFGYVAEVLTVLIGNAVGTIGVGYLFRQTKLISVAEKAFLMSQYKIADHLGSVLIMAIFCGILMCVAVVGYLTIKDSIGKHIALIFPIVVFILSGFEHSVANMFYFSIANVWSGSAVLNTLVVVLGNAIGGSLIPLTIRLLDGKRLGCN